MSSVRVLFRNNDMLVELAELRNMLTGAYVNAATVNVTLKDAAGVEVAGQAWPLAMAYVAASNGLYRATLPDTIPLVKNERYIATIAADAGGGLNATWEVEAVCRART